MQDFAPLSLPGCHWISPPTTSGGHVVESWSIADNLGFETPRLFWLTSVASGQWRGRHAHRISKLATFAVHGKCRVSLDNGRQVKTVELTESGEGLMIGPWIWHDLFEFSPGAAILVIASTTYFETDYIRDYEEFLAEASAHKLSSL